MSGVELEADDWQLGHVDDRGEHGWELTCCQGDDDDDDVDVMMMMMMMMMMVMASCVWQIVVFCLYGHYDTLSVQAVNYIIN